MQFALHQSVLYLQWLKTIMDGTVHNTIGRNTLRGPGPRIYIPPEQGGAQLHPQALGSFFVASYNSQAMVEVFELASTRG
jgi:hypothetical protein